MKLPVNYDKLTWQQRREVRLEYVRQQKNKCWYCARSLDGDPPFFIKNKPLTLYRFPEGFLDRPIHLHHDHKTGMTLGAVHAICNGHLFEYYGE